MVLKPKISQYLKAQVVLGTENRQSSSDLKLAGILNSNLEEMKTYVSEKL